MNCNKLSGVMHGQYHTFEERRKSVVDPLDWVHQWDDYEMYMYAEASSSDGEEAGIYIQVSKRSLVQGAEEWSLLYERRLSDLPVVPPAPDGDVEDALLRAYLKQNPNLVPDEKAYLAQWQSEHQMEG